jgi:hypothetical protein
LVRSSLVVPGGSNRQLYQHQHRRLAAVADDLAQFTSSVNNSLQNFRMPQSNVTPIPAASEELQPKFPFWTPVLPIFYV